MIFSNEKEVNISSSQVLKAFHMVNSVQKFLDLGIPIRKYTTPGNVSSTDLSEIYKNPQEKNIAFEIDLSNPKRIERALGVTKLDCFPVIWCQQDLQSIMWNVQLDQRIACKYIVVKLIDRHSTNPNTNIDMFPLSIDGYKLKIPSPNQYR